MFDFIKQIFIKHNLSVNQNFSGIKSYPEIIKTAGLFCANANQIDTNLITKVKNALGSQTQFLIFGIFGDDGNKDIQDLNFKQFNLFGKFINPSVKKNLSDLDMLIDITRQHTVIKDYAISFAHKAYKISMGQYAENKYHLCIDVINSNQDIFVDEMIKYHKILSHAK